MKRVETAEQTKSTHPRKIEEHHGNGASSYTTCNDPGPIRAQRQQHDENDTARRDLMTASRMQALHLKPGIASRSLVPAKASTASAANNNATTYKKSEAGSTPSPSC